ncbi:hypothetical protein CROQUDRAFT_88532 [Cronartium quercuum f. sp. fusiforme G11]|uniref:Uncharacterized protein n=1 Tax=Cronartium quercuum f. sp. fusiforme G11 TaxID=708437 RepID=A0A9P6NQU4_9BASI|nr:hypothetical protein CROQUDRAFT_88532 [Cronartium quercuum f. sp. fusiforme G11]
MNFGFNDLGCSLNSTCELNDRRRDNLQRDPPIELNGYANCLRGSNPEEDKFDGRLADQFSFKATNLLVNPRTGRCINWMGWARQSAANQEIRRPRLTSMPVLVQAQSRLFKQRKSGVATAREGVAGCNTFTSLATCANAAACAPRTTVAGYLADIVDRWRAKLPDQDASSEFGADQVRFMASQPPYAPQMDHLVQVANTPA